LRLREEKGETGGNLSFVEGLVLVLIALVKQGFRGGDKLVQRDLAIAVLVGAKDYNASKKAAQAAGKLVHVWHACRTAGSAPRRPETIG
jgi:hypothetical protein